MYSIKSKENKVILGVNRFWRKL